MDTHLDRQYLSTLGIVLGDLDHFIHQKNNQAVIFALLQIKKAARKTRTQSIASLDKKSNASRSIKNYSEPKSSLSAHSGAKSPDRHSQASFDIIKAAENFNETKKIGIPQKIYTQRFQQQQEYLAHEDQQPSSFSQPQRKFVQKGGKGNAVVPKLVGLVSSEQISDIEQPFGTGSRDNKQAKMRVYENSIEEVQDDDDQFQDIVLNRLDVIEQKVNQMLRQKRQQRISTLNSRTANTQPYHLSKSKLQNVGSGPNIIYKNSNRAEFYQYPESRYPQSTALMSPRVYTFQNSKNTSVNPGSNKMTNRSLKQNLTDRVQFSSQLVDNQNYFTDNEQYGIQGKTGNQRQVHQYGAEEGEILVKNKKLGHYRGSSKTINQPEENQMINRHSENVQKGQQTNINYTKIKEQNLDDKALKYIPLSKIKANKVQGIEQKTQRQILKNNHAYSKNVSYHPIPNNRMSVEASRKYETMSQDNVQLHHEKQQKKSQPDELLQRRVPRRQDKHRSGRDSGMRGNQLAGSDVKAYTQHGDYLGSEEDVSVMSEKNIYSEIRELREMTRIYGAEREKRQIPQAPKQKLPIRGFEALNRANNQETDYRYHQKTERMKYPSSRNHTQPVNYGQEEDVILQGDYPQERVVRVIKKIPHYPPQVHVSQGRRIQPSQYVKYSNQQVVYDQNRQNVSYEPVYVVRERPEPVYQQVQMYEESFYRGPSSNQFQTVIMHDDSKSKISHRKLSSGSINSFKSIPYVRIQDNPQVSKEKSVEYYVQRPVHYVQKTVYKQV